jgi:hypothetical protein
MDREKHPEIPAYSRVALLTLFLCCAGAERGVRVVPHPGRHGPDGRPHEDDVGQRHGPVALPQPRHLLQPARHRHTLHPLLRRAHRRLRRGSTCHLYYSALLPFISLFLLHYSPASVVRGTLRPVALIGQ